MSGVRKLNLHRVPLFPGDVSNYAMRSRIAELRGFKEEKPIELTEKMRKRFLPRKPSTLAGTRGPVQEEEPAPPEKPRGESSVMFSLEALQDIGQQREAELEQQRGEELQDAAQQRTDAEEERRDESSVMFSLEALQDIGQQRADEEPEPSSVIASLEELQETAQQRTDAEEERQDESSVMFSLEALQGVGQQREAELEQERQQELERQQMEEAARAEEQQRQQEAERLEAERRAAFEEEKRAALEQEEQERQERLELRRRQDKARQEQIRREAEERRREREAKEKPGLIWREGPRAQELSNAEFVECEVVLPEREKRWILPVPEGRTEDEQTILTSLAHMPQVKLQGRQYYILEGQFATSRRCARVGRELHYWKDEITDLEFLRERGIDAREYEDVGWPDIPSEYQANRIELLGLEGLLVDGAARLLHPAPYADTVNEWNKIILQWCARVPQVELGGHMYYVFQMSSIGEWKDVVTRLPMARMVTKKGSTIYIGEEEDNGKTLFEKVDMQELLKREAKAKKRRRRESLPPQGRVVVAARSEQDDLREILKGGQHRHIYSLNPTVGDTGYKILEQLIALSKRYTERHDKSPLMLIAGGWHVLLEKPIPGSKEVSLDRGGVLVVHQIVGSKKIGDSLQNLRLEAEVMRHFPEGKTRFLERVGLDVQSDLPSILITHDPDHRYLVHSQSIPGAQAVKRIGDKFYPAGDGEEPPQKPRQ